MEGYKDENSLVIHQTDLIPESSLLKKEILLSQFKGEVFLSSVTRTVCLQEDKVQSYPLFQGEQSPAHSVKSERLSPANPCSIKSEESSQSATTSPGLTTELENFQDLTDWCQSAPPKAPKMSVPLETDELNTPVIEYGDFVFQSPSIDQSIDNCYGLLNVPNEVIQHGLYINDVADIQLNKYDNNIGCHIFGQSNNNSINKSETSYQYFMNNDVGGGANNIFNSEPINQDLSSSSNHVFAFTTTTTTTTTPPQDPPVFEINESFHNNTEDVILLPLETVVPPNNNNKKNLQLDFTNLLSTPSIVIDTPEVINTALAMDKSFNLINFITNDSIKETTPSFQTVEPQTQFEDESRSTTTNDPDPDPSYSPSEASDDEEYEPPSSKKARRTSTSRSVYKRRLTATTKKSFIETSDSDLSNLSNIEPALMKVVRRGRPPKRHVSISSESTNADNEVSRYRELRDKNNEASRRSRLNRKLKEFSLEEEAKDLDMRNRKLKVKVQGLEQLVNTMRNNLMQMLLKK